jgi:hypothetical protein
MLSGFLILQLFFEEEHLGTFMDRQKKKTKRNIADEKMLSAN